MLLLFGHLLDRGDEVILSDPYYACYPNFIRYAEGVPVPVPIFEADHFQFRPEEIERRRGPRTRAIIVNSPANPTGAVLGAERMEAIAGLADGDDLFIVSDEIYHGLSYEGRDRSILEFTDRAFVLNGFSKAFAMTGWRLGYLIGPRAHIRALQTLFGNFYISTNEFVQWAGVAALTEGLEESHRFRAIFDDRRRAMIAGLRAVGLGVGFEPTGAFYVLANAQRYTSDSTRLAYELLESAHVAVTPGAAFGPNAEGYLRFSYASSIERISEGLRRVGRALAARA
jgi:aspartate/methionine/tyrosine aminotransferase